MNSVSERICSAIMYWEEDIIDGVDGMNKSANIKADNNKRKAMVLTHAPVLVHGENFFT